MKLQFAGLTDTGLVRSANQDAYCIDDPDGRFFIVADGMGGHAGGEEASRIATQAIRDFLQEYWTADLQPLELLEQAFIKANHEIVQRQRVSPERADMGTTAVVVIFPKDGSPWCAHVGDSRLYRWHQSKLVQVTEDHTWVAQAVKAGVLTADQSRVHPWRHVLAQCLGREELYNIDIQPFELEVGDRLLLCSDGLTEEVPDERIAELLNPEQPCQTSAQVLVQQAKDNGGQDNITVVLISAEIAS
jgi:PPM family protein phosphatase